MQVVSGALSRRPVVHFEAPPAGALPNEMAALFRWVSGPSRQLDGLLASGLAHLWFVTIHPFDDGNGRLARALSDLMLARADGLTRRFWSMSSQIERDRAEYYRVLEQTQRQGLDVTEWLAWFIGCFSRCIELSTETLVRVRTRSAFWTWLATQPPLSDRQQKMLRRVLEQDTWTTTVKQWAVNGRCSIDTAQRDISVLVERGVLLRGESGGSKTSFHFGWRLTA
jgi:Fic family protein